MPYPDNRLYDDCPDEYDNNAYRNTDRALRDSDYYHYDGGWYDENSDW